MKIAYCNTDMDPSVRIYGDVDSDVTGKLTIGKNVRIDAFTVITIGDKGVSIGDNVHIGVGCFLSGAHGRIQIGNCCSLSARVTIYTGIDQVADDNLIGACCPMEGRRLITGDVTICDGAAILTNAIILPLASVGIGAVVGANTLLRHSVSHGEVVAGQEVVRTRNWKQIKEMVNAANRKPL